MRERVDENQIYVGDEIYTTRHENSSKFKVIEIENRTLWLEPLNEQAEAYSRSSHKNLMPFGAWGVWYKEKFYINPIKKIKEFKL